MAARIDSVKRHLVTVGITYDWGGPPERAPVVGDYLHGAQTAYEIITCRQVRSEIHPCRFAIRAIRLPEDAVPVGVMCHPIVWHRREKKPS